MPIYNYRCAECNHYVYPSVSHDLNIVNDSVWCEHCINNVQFVEELIGDLTIQEEAGRGLETPEWPSPSFPTGAPRQPTRSRSHAISLDKDEDIFPDYFDEEGSDFVNRYNAYGVPPPVIDLTDSEDSGDITQTDYDELRKQAGDKRKSPVTSDPQRAWAATWYLWKSDEEFNVMWARDPITGLPKAVNDSPAFKRFWNNSSITYLIAGKEKCPTTGRLHLQIAFYVKGKLRFSTLQKIMPGARLAPCRKPLQANINYCRKEKDFAEKGVRPLTKQEGAMARLHLLDDFLRCPMRTVEEYDIVLDSCKALCGEAIDLVCDVMHYNNNKY